MAWIYSEGMLEPEEVQEDMNEVMTVLNTAGNNNWMFAKLHDDVGDPIIFQVPLIAKVRTAR